MSQKPSTRIEDKSGRASSRALFSGCLVALLALTSPPSALSQDNAASAYPTKAVRIVVPFTAGGPQDSIARLLSTGLSPVLGQSFLVDNRPGAGGAIGADFVAKSPADGYTLLICNISDSIAVSLNPSLPYHFQRDFAPVSLLMSTPFVVVVNPSVPARNISEFIQLARSKPGTLTFGSAGIGVASHLVGEFFAQVADIKVSHVPYKGQSQATADLLGGQIAFMFNTPLVSLPLVKAGKLHALAVSGKQRISAAPDIPTVAESGLPGFDVDVWFGLTAPAATPAPIVAKLSAEIARILKSKETSDSLSTQGAVAVGSTPAEFARVIQTDIAKWERVIRVGKITAQ